eukprot:CAMPEP_0172683744 /NCGR_PEP_ID=MMETSP1074-20121228/19068_1 /TAXON_ID=2916 /ORGANISM="Ceratium fusus, Strain PA161109" /LENGTH=66 /DNA_ID=CAMNT_0013502639 /DNA_START=169 /DNA_END=365 /DNA_ORIENTATION=+
MLQCQREKYRAKNATFSLNAPSSPESRSRVVSTILLTALELEPDAASATSPKPEYAVELTGALKRR